MEIKAVIFDLGGVLLRTYDHQPRNQLAARFGMSSEVLEKLVFNSKSSGLASLGRISVTEHWRWVAEQLGVPVQQTKSLAADFFAGDRYDQALLDALRGFRPARKTALLSNAWDDLRQYLEKSGIHDVFDEIIISAEVGMVKPQEGIYRLALQRLRLSAQHAIFVDDFIENVEAARALGIHAIHFRETSHALREIDRLLDARD